jgi:hypothetical protein
MIFLSESPGSNLYLAIALLCRPEMSGAPSEQHINFFAIAVMA